MSDWIPCNEHLPPTDGKVLIYAPSADDAKPLITTAWYDPNGFGWSMLPENWLRAITHWMPLPAGPKSG
jgi:hypothetical protein